MFKHFENNLTTVKVLTKTKVAPFYLGHGVVVRNICGIEEWYRLTLCAMFTPALSIWFTCDMSLSWFLHDTMC